MQRVWKLCRKNPKKKLSIVIGSLVMAGGEERLAGQIPASSLTGGRGSAGERQEGPKGYLGGWFGGSRWTGAAARREQAAGGVALPLRQRSSEV